MKIQAGVPGVARGIKKNEFEEKTIKKYLLIFNKKSSAHSVQLFGPGIAEMCIYKPRALIYRCIFLSYYQNIFFSSWKIEMLFI